MKIKSIIMSVLMCVTLASCQAIDSKNNKIDLIELFEENGDIVKEACSYRDYSYLINSEEYRDSTIEVKIENQSTLGFLNNYISCAYHNNQKIFFKKALTVNYPTEKTIYAMEMRNEQKAIQVFNQMDKNICFVEWKQEKNIIYYDSYIYHLLLGNYIKDGNNFLTIDGKGILTNLSKDSIINIPDVEEIKPDAFRLHRNIKYVFLNENLVIIGYCAFINCSNLEKVFFNNDQKLSLLYIPRYLG